MGTGTKIVGLTGGIGSGKSSVGRLLLELGATLIDADAIVHEMQAPGSPLLRQIADAFGEDVIDATGALDRKALAARVFGDEAARARLGSIMHPPVIAEMLRRALAARDAGAPLVVLDIPLLLEGRKSGRGSGAIMDFDAVIVVYTPESVQIERTMARDGATRDEVEARVGAQLSIEEKRRLADHVIDNSGSPEETERQVRALFAELTRPHDADRAAR